jgi:hypothetical protein
MTQELGLMELIFGASALVQVVMLILGAGLSVVVVPDCAARDADAAC